MFDKNKFAKILKNINESYSSQRDFAKKSEINRTYLSQYMNIKLDKPPKPEILQKLANSSHHIVSYKELMKVCGYINNDSNDELLLLYDELNELEKNRKVKKNKLNLNEMKISSDLFDQVLKCLHDGHTTPETFDPFVILNDLDFISNKSKIKISEDLKETFNYFYEKSKIKKKIANIEWEEHTEKDLNLRGKSSKTFYNKNRDVSHLFLIPILGKVTAGHPILADEYLEGYLPVDPNIYGMTTPDDYFYLKVSGESMNIKIQNGDYALIHKQDYAENGDIIVAIVNSDDEATLKKYKKLTDELVMLEPMSTYPMEPLVVNLKETKFQIIGKAIGHFGKF